MLYWWYSAGNSLLWLLQSVSGMENLNADWIPVEHLFHSPKYAILVKSIKELAEQKGMSQSRLQRESKVTMYLLRRYWSNKTESVTLAALDQIAVALGVKGTDLLEDVEKSESPPTASS